MRRKLVAASSIVLLFAAFGGIREAGAICGFPGFVVSSIAPAPAGAPDTGFVILFTPVAPFAFAGLFSVPTGTPFGDHAMSMAIDAVTSAPVNFMAADGPGALCGAFCPPPAPAPFGVCAATIVGLFS